MTICQQPDCHERRVTNTPSYVTDINLAVVRRHVEALETAKEQPLKDASLRTACADIKRWKSSTHAFIVFDG
jgi:hypothetical protein